MDLCGEFVTHKVFGRGRIIGLENDFVTVLFLELNENKKFIYPSAFGRFLNLENDQLVKQIQSYKNEIAQNIADAQKESEVKKALEKQQKVKSAKKTTRKAPKHKAVKKSNNMNRLTQISPREKT